LAVKNVASKAIGLAQQNLIDAGVSEKIEFVPGLLNNSIPEYLIENPELKIALLTIDIDDYESTLTAMQYFYPRIVNGGILIMNNYYKKSAESLAIQEYFYNEDVIVRHFSLEKAHYIVKA
jgi:predicted O-methyltransferase YrrM